ncbi:PREDICTED: spermatogenesis-associated protein 33 [Galeopterus variegatus]|uniref:Spermatogenesis-associated protein 33 n=1 Tax=Galeopterus variegatus TaxID=482537 RepID=A0ABM0Q076_GALVR|nr:PREDICTED: spermatogenesis-associated protein 33 [Galeopterus variegatus]
MVVRRRRPSERRRGRESRAASGSSSDRTHQLRPRGLPGRHPLPVARPLSREVVAVATRAAPAFVSQRWPRGAGAAAGAPMGLCKSKAKPRRGEERKRAPAPTVPKCEERPTEEPADCPHPGAETAGPRCFLLLEKPDAQQKSSKKSVPEIIITQASNETLVTYSSTGSKEQRTIREQAEWGPYHRHRKPSTVDAYSLDIKESTSAPE